MMGMADEPENLTLRLLQDIRDDIRDIRSDIADFRATIADLTQRVDGNTLTFNLVAGVVYDHEERISKLEG